MWNAALQELANEIVDNNMIVDVDIDFGTMVAQLAFFDSNVKLLGKPCQSDSEYEIVEAASDAGIVAGVAALVAAVAAAAVVAAAVALVLDAI